MKDFIIKYKLAIGIILAVIVVSTVGVAIGVFFVKRHTVIASNQIENTQATVLETEQMTSQEETTTAEETTEETSAEVVEEEQIMDMLSSGEVTILDTDSLNIGEDDSDNTMDNVEVVDKDEDATPSNSYEVSQLVHGIDVSKWQGDIDWSAVADYGITFAMIKCGGRSTGSEGDLYEDSKFQQNIQGALANGIQVGIYFFSQATSVSEAYEEASMCVNLINQYQITYPVAFDWESADGYRVNDIGVSVDDLTTYCQVFCDTVVACGYNPMIYFCRNDWYNAVNGSTLTSKYKTWLAVHFLEYYYTENTFSYGDDLPSFRYNYQMWQYGVTDTIPGIDAYVDMNIAFFTYSDYTVDNLQDAKLNVQNKTISCNVGAELDLMNGVTGTNSIGYSADIDYQIFLEDGTEISIDDVINTPGTYKVVYSFKDPRQGVISVNAVLTVIQPQTETASEPQTGQQDSSQDASQDATQDGTQETSQGESQSQKEKESKTKPTGKNHNNKTE
jgi:GH25 family lysozyme M1 (1,4-beta-N-acetylmuramidase)